MKAIYPQTKRVHIDDFEFELAPLRWRDRQTFHRALLALHAQPTNVHRMNDARLCYRIVLARTIRSMKLEGQPAPLDFRKDKPRELDQRCVAILVDKIPHHVQNALAHALVEFMFDEAPFEVTDHQGAVIEDVQILPSTKSELN